MNKTFDKLKLTIDGIRKTTSKNLVTCHPFDKLRMTLSESKGHMLHVKGQRGFTLIELLVVIAIIGILMTFLTVTYAAVRMRSRDAQRKSDLRQIQSALELYRADNDSYPATFPNCGGSFIGVGASPPTYMTKIPCDPVPANGSYKYGYISTTQYAVASCIENTGDQDTNIAATLPTSITSFSCSSNKYYVLYNP